MILLVGSFYLAVPVFINKTRLCLLDFCVFQPLWQDAAADETGRSCSWLCWHYGEQKPQVFITSHQNTSWKTGDSRCSPSLHNRNCHNRSLRTKVIRSQNSNVLPNVKRKISVSPSVSSSYYNEHKSTSKLSVLWY